MIGKHYLACAFISVAMVAGCSNDQSQGDVIATVGDEAITETQFDAYLKFKNVPADNSARRDKELENYLQREALAAAIAQQEQMDEALIEGGGKCGNFVNRLYSVAISTHTSLSR